MAATVKRILAFDIGGTGLKAALVDGHGKFLSEKLRIPTPHPCKPKAMVKLLVELAKPFKGYDAVTIGFPGYVKRGVVHTAPNLGTTDWAGFALEKAMSKALGKPARLINDADVQGLAAIKGNGLELVVTLGTGFGTAWFADGQLLPHLEFAHVPVHHGYDFDIWIGEVHRRKISILAAATPTASISSCRKTLAWSPTRAAWRARRLSGILNGFLQKRRNRKANPARDQKRAAQRRDRT